MPKRIKSKHVGLSWYGDEIAETVKRSMEPGLWAMGGALLHAAQGRAPRRSGRLRDSGFIATADRTDYRRGRGDRRRRELARLMGQVSPKSVLVAFAVWYSNLIEDTGTKRHAIPYVPRSTGGRVRRTLRIPGIGFRKRVSHPGFRSTPFLGPALDASKDTASEAFAREVHKRLERGR